MTEIIVRYKEKKQFSEFLKNSDLFNTDVGIIINDNFSACNVDHGVTLSSCVVHNRRIPKFLYEEFKNRYIESLSIDNETAAVTLYLY